MKQNRWTSLKYWQIGAVLILLGGIASLYTQNPVVSHTEWKMGECHTAKVIRVADGDTATLLDATDQSVRVRLAFIDAPELSQPYGQASQQSLSQKIQNEEVFVKVWDKDRYGRIVGQIWLKKEDMGFTQMTNGYAWHYGRYAKKQQSKDDFARYKKAQKVAQEAKLGLWQQKHPIPPWRFRQQSLRQ